MDEGRDEHLGDDVVELVLGTVDGDRRARMAAHVLRCAACRHEYDELAATVEDLLPAVPAVQPPLGFDERVLARIAAGRTPAPTRADRRRWTWVAVAAAALVALARAARHLGGVARRRRGVDRRRRHAAPLPRRHGRRHGVAQRHRRGAGDGGRPRRRARRRVVLLPDQLRRRLDGRLRELAIGQRRLDRAARPRWTDGRARSTSSPTAPRRSGPATFS